MVELLKYIWHFNVQKSMFKKVQGSGFRGSGVKGLLLLRSAYNCALALAGHGLLLAGDRYPLTADRIPIVHRHKMDFTTWF